MGKPIFITGAGIVSAIGLNKQEVLSSLLAGKSGIADVRYLDTEHREFPVGEVKLTNEQMVNGYNSFSFKACNEGGFG